MYWNTSVQILKKKVPEYNFSNTFAQIKILHNNTFFIYHILQVFLFYDLIKYLSNHYARNYNSSQISVLIIKQFFILFNSLFTLHNMYTI